MKSEVSLNPNKKLRIIIDMEIPEDFFQGCYQHWIGECEDEENLKEFEDYCYEQLHECGQMEFSPVGGFWSIDDLIQEAFESTGGIDYEELNDSDEDDELRVKKR